jgi:hypothetical protein
MSAIQARINKAIEDRLRGDTVATPTFAGDSLEALLLAQGAVIEDRGIPLWWTEAHAGEQKPYLIYGPQARESEIESNGCGVGDTGTIPYEVGLVQEGYTPSGGIAIVDRLARLLDGYKTTVEGIGVQLWRTGDFCYPDPLAGEVGITRSGVVYRVRVGL